LLHSINVPGTNTQHERLIAVYCSTTTSACEKTTVWWSPQAGHTLVIRTTHRRSPLRVLCAVVRALNADFERMDVRRCFLSSAGSTVLATPARNWLARSVARNAKWDPKRGSEGE